MSLLTISKQNILQQALDSLKNQQKQTPLGNINNQLDIRVMTEQPETVNNYFNLHSKSPVNNTKNYILKPKESIQPQTQRLITKDSNQKIAIKQEEKIQIKPLNDNNLIQLKLPKNIQNCGLTQKSQFFG